MKQLLAAVCLVVFHSPDGKLLRVDASHITAVRALPMGAEEHVAKGTKSILYVEGQKFGVTETPEAIEALIKECK